MVADDRVEPVRGAAVEARSLSRRFGARTVLSNVTLDVEPGETFGLLGANGAGKTTFIRLVIGTLLPSAGRVRVDGRSPSDSPSAVQRDVGYVPESARLQPELSVLRYLRFSGGVRGLGGTADGAGTGPAGGSGGVSGACGARGR